jgi:choline kinase
VKIIILAAGRGKRMGNLTDLKHKSLSLYKGRPLIEWTLASCREYVSETDILIIGGYRYRDLRHVHANLRVNKNWSETNIVGSMLVARDYLSQDDCIVVYSDVYFEKTALAKMVLSEGASVLCVDNWLSIWRKRFVNPLDDLESFKLDNLSGELLEIGLEPKNFSEIQGQFGGMVKFTPKVWREIEQKIHDLNTLDTTTLIQSCLVRGIGFKVVHYSGNWAEFDNSLDVETQC